MTKLKTKTKKVPKKAVGFYNQMTIVVRSSEEDTDDYDSTEKINVKLFKNGSIQMSGCKQMDKVNIVLNKIIVRLREVNAIINKVDPENEDNTSNAVKISKILYVEEKDLLNVNSFKVDMINSNYKLALNINRQELYSLLISMKIQCSYEPCIRACVIVKYTPDKFNEENKEISIFIFQKGNIIITGAKKVQHIIMAYNYINDIIKTNKDQIRMTDLDNIIKEVGLGHLISN
jgi:TATA-box binding protein (TBP) (component of TFIID and TFIIIB)